MEKCTTFWQRSKHEIVRHVFNMYVPLTFTIIKLILKCCTTTFFTLSLPCYSFSSLFKCLIMVKYPSIVPLKWNIERSYFGTSRSLSNVSISKTRPILRNVSILYKLVRFYNSQTCQIIFICHNVSTLKHKHVLKLIALLCPRWCT